MRRWSVAIALLAACGQVSFGALEGSVERLAYWPFALTVDELAAAGLQ